MAFVRFLFPSLPTHDRGTGKGLFSFSLAENSLQIKMNIFSKEKLSCLLQEKWQKQR
jgi:hypothetical protein